MATTTDVPFPKVGDIFVSSWGYDQTNIDFYEVVKATKATVTVRAIGKRVVADKGSQTLVEAVPGDFLEHRNEPQVKRPRACGSYGWAITISSCQTGFPWNGQPRYETGFGWGH